MAKVVAIHEIIRPGEVIKPGKSFISTGEELKELKAAGAVKIDTSDAEDVDDKVVNDTGKDAADDKKAVSEKKPTAAAKKAAAADKDLV